EALRAAEARRAGDDAQPRRQLQGFGASATHLKREHSAEAAHLSAGNVMTRMRGQPGIVHRFYVLMGGETLRERQSVRGVRPHPPRERAHAAHREPALERRWNGTDRRLDGANALCQIIVGAHDEGAAEHVTVPTEVL